jgi:hypothetical protein
MPQLDLHAPVTSSGGVHGHSGSNLSENGPTRPGQSASPRSLWASRAPCSAGK